MPDWTTLLACELFMVLFCQMPKSSEFMMSNLLGSGPASPPKAMPLGASGILCAAINSGPNSYAEGACIVAEC